MEIQTLVENRFKDKLPPDKFAMWKDMSIMVDTQKPASLTWTGYDALAYQNNHNVISTFNIPTLKDWDEFLNHKFISGVLLDLVVKSKHTTLRKIIASIDERKNLSQGDMKALTALQELITKSDEQDNSVQYIQYISPTRFDENSSADLIKKYEIKEDQHE